MQRLRNGVPADPDHHFSLIGRNVIVRTPGHYEHECVLVALGTNRVVVSFDGHIESLPRIMTTRVELHPDELEPATSAYEVSASDEEASLRPHKRTFDRPVRASGESAPWESLRDTMGAIKDFHHPMYGPDHTHASCEHPWRSHGMIHVDGLAFTLCPGAHLVPDPHGPYFMGIEH